MRFGHIPIFLVFTVFLVCGLGAQDKAGREINVHKNVLLIEAEVPQELTQEFKNKYQKFLPVFEEVLKESTSEQSSDGALIVRVVPGIKEIGAAKTKRVIARISAYRRNSKREFVGSLILHSYATGDTVSKEEIEQFLKKQILSPLGVS